MNIKDNTKIISNIDDIQWLSTPFANRRREIPASAFVCQGHGARTRRNKKEVER